MGKDGFMRFVCLIMCLCVLVASLGGCSGGGSGGGVAAVSYSLVGTWRLTNPTGSSLQLGRLRFNSDGSAVAFYVTGASVTGTWSLSGNNLTLTLTGGGSIYLTINWVDVNHFNTNVEGIDTSWERTS